MFLAGRFQPGTEIWRGGPYDGVTNLIRYAVRVSDYSVNSMIRPAWDAFETQQGVYHFEKMDKLFEYGIQYGQKVNLACFVTSCAGTKQKIDDAFCCYPACGSHQWDGVQLCGQ